MKSTCVSTSQRIVPAIGTFLLLFTPAGQIDTAPQSTSLTR
jgi:hypothetical protein